jgi:hypothetical protein
MLECQNRHSVSFRQVLRIMGLVPSGVCDDRGDLDITSTSASKWCERRVFEHVPRQALGQPFQKCRGCDDMRNTRRKVSGKDHSRSTPVVRKILDSSPSLVSVEPIESAEPGCRLPTNSYPAMEKSSKEELTNTYSSYRYVRATRNTSSYVDGLDSPGARSVFGKGFLQGSALGLPIEGRDASGSLLSLDRPSVEPRHFCAVKGYRPYDFTWCVQLRIYGQLVVYILTSAALFIEPFPADESGHCIFLRIVPAKWYECS